MGVFFGPEPCQQLAGVRKDGDAGPKVGEAAIGTQIRTDFADKAQRTGSGGYMQCTGPVHDAGPLRLVFSVAVEHLDAMVRWFSRSAT